MKLVLVSVVLFLHYVPLIQMITSYFKHGSEILFAKSRGLSLLVA